MSRQPRTCLPDSISHVTSRGVERRDIFLGDQDRHVFMKYLKDELRARDVSLLAYCLMGNHFHLLLAQRLVSLSVFMHSLLTRYSLYFNHVHERVGHLFQGRFFSTLCEDDAYLIHLPVYIHRNPLRAKLVRDVGDWQWSGHKEFVSGEGEYLDHSRLMELAGMSPAELRERYLERVLRADEPPGASMESAEALLYLARKHGVSLRDIVTGTRCLGVFRAKSEFLRWGALHAVPDADLAAALGCSREAIRQFRSRSCDSRA
jgi:REP element-mobilizing transposase RayT